MNTPIFPSSTILVYQLRYKPKANHIYSAQPWADCLSIQGHRPGTYRNTLGHAVEIYHIDDKMNAQYYNTYDNAVEIFYKNDNGTKAGDIVKVTGRTPFEVWYKATATYYSLPPSAEPNAQTEDEEEIESLRHLRLSKLVSFAGLGYYKIGSMVKAEAAGQATCGPKLWEAARGYYAGEIKQISAKFSHFTTIGDEWPTSFSTSTTILWQIY